MQMQQKLIIAIDGYSSCGKSTLARELANKLGYRYIDTGAMYRAVTYYFLENNIPFDNRENVKDILPKIKIDFQYDPDNGKQITILNGVNVEKALRAPQVSEKVSLISTIKEVRSFLVNQQQRLGLERGIVMDGRDIGTVVFPDAELKFFMTANEEVRIARRKEELMEAGINLSIDEVRENIRKRDHIDTHRFESPLKKAKNAILIDNTLLSKEEQLELTYKIAMNILDKASVKS